MRNVSIGEPIVIAQSTSEPILFGGYQDPYIRCNAKGELFVRFNSRRDCHETWGQEDHNPVYKSVDSGESWEILPDSLYSWITAQKPLPNGDYLQMREHPIVTDLPALPELPENRRNCSAIANTHSVYRVDELLPCLGNRVAKEFNAYRIKAGTREIEEEICKVNWADMPLSLFQDSFIARVFGGRYQADKNGVLWMPVHAPFITPNGELGSRRSCLHMLRSDDMGHTWDYVSTVAYREEYNDPKAIDVEGFSESTLEILDDGSLFCIMRSGSLHPFQPGDDEHPAPKLYCVKSTNGGKTWSEPTQFYDYGILPVSVKMGCGVLIMASGRPGVYLRICDDPKAERWNDVIPILSVPKEDIYKAYFEYSCSNTGLCAYDDHVAFLTYSNFQLTAPDGRRAKSILVRKIVIE